MTVTVFVDGNCETVTKWVIPGRVEVMVTRPPPIAIDETELATEDAIEADAEAADDATPPVPETVVVITFPPVRAVSIESREGKTQSCRNRL